MLRGGALNLLAEARAAMQSCGGGWLSPTHAQTLRKRFQLTPETLARELIPLAQQLARPLLSHFAVGCVAIGDSGAFYLGANFELPGGDLREAIHAEQTAVVQASTHDERGIHFLAVSAPPCGGCRQFLNELASSDRLQVQWPDHPAQQLDALLPFRFGPANLGNSKRRTWSPTPLI